MPRSPAIVLVVGLVVVASLAGVAGSATAQSDSEVVTLTVEVVNPSTNQRLGGVDLVARWNGGQATATTASNGRAFLDVPEAATVEITVEDDEYTRNEPYRIRVATEREHTIEVARRATLDVTVRDAEGPVADARVTLRQDGTAVVTGRTDSNGGFASGTVAQGQYTLSVVKPGYYRTTQEVIVAGSPERTVDIERGRVDYDVVVEDPNFDPAQPVSDATVSIERVGDLTTDDRGAASALVPVNSELRVQVTKDGYGTATETIRVNESAGSTVFSITRESSLSLTVLNERVVVGEVVAVEVTDAYGEPAAGVGIVVDGERVAETDSNGEATVRIDAAGENELRARRGGTTSDPVTVRGVGEGGGEPTAAQETDVTPTAAGTGTPGSAGSGLGPLAVLAPIVALVVLGLVLVVGVVYWRRRGGDDSWSDGENGTAGQGSMGGVGTVDDTPAGSGEPMAGDESMDAAATDTEEAADDATGTDGTGTGESESGEPDRSGESGEAAGTDASGGAAGTDASGEAAGTDESSEADGTDESSEADEIDGSGEANESGDPDGPGETDGTDEPDEPSER
ncbi:carboxypeptidase regulatory-like domain-containing protein [Salinigranum sp. GCM10025319]|uniref:carboxypeptidase regulatory-like domain-containing protein n=1 Tax=Salinigranum sp. GCM10025319 TaxID=3252687 RepID=UPI00361C40E9